MAHVVKWPTITDLRHLIARTEKDPNVAALAQQHRGGIAFRGKVKLHGANHAVTALPDGSFIPQSRNIVLKPGSGGFAAWARERGDYFTGLFQRATAQQQATPLRSSAKAESGLTVFGEWAGPGVQKGSSVAVGQLPEHIFAVFGVAYAPLIRGSSLTIIVEPETILGLLGGPTALPRGMHVIPWHAEARTVLDVLAPSSRTFVQAARAIDRLVAEIDKEDPWVRDTFGVRGPGEGIVWYPMDLCDSAGGIDADLFADFAFKTKGLEHQMLSQRRGSATPIPSCIDAISVARSPEDFAEMVCSRPRMLQGLSETCPEITEDGLPMFVEWMLADVHKEAAMELEASGLGWEEVENPIRSYCEAWFHEQLVNQTSSTSSAPKAEATPPLASCEICFSEAVPFKTKGDMTKRIKAAGGNVLFSLSKKCTHLVASPEDTKPGHNSSRVQKALELGCAVVTERFVTESIEQGIKLDATAFNPLAPQQPRGTQDEKSTTRRRRIVERPHVWSFGTGKEPRFSLDYDIVRTVVLQATDFARANTNKFYAIELHVSREAFADGYVYRIFTQHGRTDELAAGKRGVCESRYLSTLDDAEVIFEDIVQAKLEDGAYHEVDLVTIGSRIGSRAVLGLSSGDAAPLQRVEASELPEAVQSIVGLVFEKASAAVTRSVAATVTRRGIETPLGVTSVAQIDRAQQVLDAIGNAISQRASDELARLNGEFFSLIPSVVGTKKRQAQQAVVDTEAKLEEKQELLDLMRDLARVAEARTQRPGISDIEESYEALGCTIVPLDCHSATFKALQARFVSGSLSDEKPRIPRVSSSSGPAVRVLNIFKISRKSEQAPFAQALSAAGGKQKLLWHCSRVENFLGMLSRGLLTPAALATLGGRKGPLAKRTDFGFLGAGCYFSDSSLASLKYAGQGDRLLMLGVSVATGVSADFSTVQPSLKAAPPGCHSAHGVKRGPAAPNSDFENDEYVVYNESQMKLEFLVEFCRTAA